MRKFMLLFPVLAALAIGCSEETSETQQTDTGAGVAGGESTEGLTFVSLKVPNMV